MKTLKKIMTILSAMFTIALLAFVVFIRVDPDQTSQFIGYQFYTVLTDSMEPVIPTYSFVLSKRVDQDDELMPGQIITFRADRFGVETVFTHYLKKIEEVDGITYYRTQGENAPDHYDHYQTTRADIIGIYQFHIPYVGKFALFLQSEYALLLAAELAIIWMVNFTVKAKWDEENIGFALHDVMIDERNGCFVIVGEIENLFRKPVHFIKAEVYLYNEKKELIRKEPWYLSGKDYLQPQKKHSFTFITAPEERVAHFDIFIRRYKY